MSPLERFYTRSPYSIVTVVARIKGTITEDMLRNAVSKIQQRHTLLRVRVKEDSNHNPWFTSEGVKEIPVEIVPRKSDDHWINVYRETCKIPFEFEERPAIRFILVHSPNISELLILCHHIICDGMSLAYLARDLMVHLGDSNRDVEVLPDSVPIDKDNMPPANALVKFLINRMNKKWENEKVYFDQEDYRNLNETYWMNAKHNMFSVELSEAQTSALVERCRKEGITVNTALTTAFVGAQCIVQGDKPYHSSIAIAGSVRELLQRPVGEVMGFYAGGVILKYKYNQKIGFWENSRKVHRKTKNLYTLTNLLKEFTAYFYLEPAILESRNFKVIGKLVPPQFTRHQKISSFSKRDDLVLSILRRERIASLNNVFLGIAITNLTRMNFLRKYGTLELDRLMFKPGGAFPLANVNLLLGAVTCAGKLSLVVEYAEATVDTRTMEKIKNKAMEFLLNE